VGALEALQLSFGSLEARGAVVGGVDAVTTALNRPDRHLIGREEGSGFRGEGHGHVSATTEARLSLAGGNGSRSEEASRISCACRVMRIEEAN
jgi:hypothetical protein